MATAATKPFAWALALASSAARASAAAFASASAFAIAAARFLASSSAFLRACVAMDDDVRAPSYWREH